MKNIAGEEGRYAVTPDGRVWSIRFNRWVKPCFTTRGYLCVHLGRIKTALVHRLVAQAYLEPDINRPFVNHKDGVMSNNCVSNLEWCTQAENNQHAYDIGLNPGKRHFFNNKEKLTVKIFHRAGVSKLALAKKYGCSEGTIRRAVK